MLQFKSITPLHVLYYFGEPIVFVSNGFGQPLLCMKVDEDGDQSIYLVVPTSEQLLEQLNSGSISMRAAFYQPWCWLVRTNDNFEVGSAECRSAASLSDDMLPEPGAGLYPAHGVIKDSFYILSRPDPFMAIKFQGRELKGGCLKLGTLKGLVEEVYSSMRRIFIPVVNAVTSRPISEAAQSRILQMPIHLQIASLKIDLDKPELDTSAIKKSDVKFDVESASEKMTSASSSFLADVNILDQFARAGHLSSQSINSRSLALGALYQLVPTDKTPFDVLEITGTPEGKAPQKVTVGVESGNRIRDAYEEAIKDLADVTGRIVETNSMSDTFVLQDKKGREITCIVSSKVLKGALQSYLTGAEVTVSGRFQKRVRRDQITVDTIAFADGTVLSRF